MQIKLGLLLVLAACGGSTTPAATTAAPTETATSAPAATATTTTTSTTTAAGPKTLDKLTLKLPADWKKDFDASISKCLTVVGVASATAPAPAINICPIDHVPGSSGADLVAFMQKEHRMDKDLTAEIVAKEDWPGGFAATYKVRAPSDPPKYSSRHFTAVWKVGDDLLWCDGRGFVNDAQRDQVKAVCQSASW